MSKTMSEAANCIIENVLTASKITKRIDGQLSYHGISYTEYLIMHHLSGSALKTMRRIELAERVGISASGITRLLAPMQKIKLVEKEINPRDARQSLVKLSAVGQELYRDASVSFEHCAQQLLENLSAKQVDTLRSLTAKIG